MGSKLDRFLDLCEEQGVVFKDAGQGLRFHECPFCGTNKWKAWLFKESLRGKCARCEKTYSAEYLLVSMGIDRSLISSALGVEMSGDLEIDDTPTEHDEETQEEPEVEWLQGWVKISDWPEHEAALYANSRGVDESLYEEILISPISNAVVFLCKSLSGKVIGYQSRYVHPGAGPKTSTMTGFRSHQSVMFYLREGKPIVACEGPFDAVAAYRMGFSAGCTFGSNISYSQLLAFAQAAALNKSKGLLAGFDDDDAGHKAKRKFLTFCQDHEIKAKVIYPGSGKDLNEAFCKGAGFRIEEEDPDVMLLSSLSF